VEELFRSRLTLAAKIRLEAKIPETAAPFGHRTNCPSLIRQLRLPKMNVPKFPTS
jgi:hypothetical protein